MELFRFLTSFSLAFLCLSTPPCSLRGTFCLFWDGWRRSDSWFHFNFLQVLDHSGLNIDPLWGKPCQEEPRYMMRNNEPRLSTCCSQSK